MWENKNTYHGLSILPFSDHTYKQAPFQSCTEEKYNELLNNLKEIDLTKVIEEVDDVQFGDTVACGADGCEVK